MSKDKLPTNDLLQTSALKAIQRQQKLFKDFVTPSMRLEKTLKEISYPHDQFSKLIKDVDRYRNWATLPDNLTTFKNQLGTVHKLSDRTSIFASALKDQELLGLSDRVQDAIRGFTFNDKIAESMKQFSTLNDRIAEIRDSLAADSIFLGEYDFDDEDEIDPKDSSSGLILPEEIQKPLKNVNFLPIALIRKIYDDPTLLRRIKPRDFEYFVAELIERLGFENVTVTPRSGDGGQDILATKFFNDIPMLFSFECKRYSKSNKIKPEIMRALFGTVSASNSKANKGVLVTTSTFSPGAKSFIASEPLIDGKDFYDLVKWINQVKK